MRNSDLYLRLRVHGLDKLLVAALSGMHEPLFNAVQQPKGSEMNANSGSLPLHRHRCADARGGSKAAVLFLITISYPF